jgi:Rieske Fe-S protein
MSTSISDRKEIPEDPSRRTFCVHAASCLALGALTQACGGGGTGPSNAPALAIVSGSASGSTVVVQIDAASPLATVGGAAQVRASNGAFLVSRTGQDTFTALTATCTHDTCTITGFDGADYVCPCHGSRFTTAGRVANGPATTSLRVFATVFANNVLTITA